jgi:hypothetical protein
MPCEETAGKEMQKEIQWSQIFRRRRREKKQATFSMAVSRLLKPVAPNVLFPPKGPNNAVVE